MIEHAQVCATELVNSDGNPSGPCDCQYAERVLLAAAIEASGLTHTAFARQVLVRDPRSLRRWLAGGAIPQSVIRWLKERQS